MDGDDKATAEAEANQDDESSERQRSTIGFPYMGLKDAMEVAQAINNKVGSGNCDDAQLAVWLGLSAKSSGYRVRLTAARLFGVIQSAGSGTHSLTELGLDICDANREKQAKVTAFLNVPLFQKLFEKWNGRQLPPTAALEREIAGLGVAEKQKERARQVFERSAQLAGFFESGKGVLVKPGFANREPPAPEKDDSRNGGGGNGGDGGGGGGKKGIDPILQGLIDRLPPSGDVWPVDQRKLWLQILESSFQLVYKESKSKNGEAAE